MVSQVAAAMWWAELNLHFPQSQEKGAVGPAHSGSAAWGCSTWKELL